MKKQIFRLLLIFSICVLFLFFFFPSKPSLVVDIALDTIGLLPEQDRELALKKSMEVVSNTGFLRRVDVGIPLALLLSKKKLDRADKDILVYLFDIPILSASQKYRVLVLLSEYLFLTNEFELLQEYLWQYIITEPRIPDFKIQHLRSNFELLDLLSRQRKTSVASLEKSDSKTEFSTNDEIITQVKRRTKLPLLNTSPPSTKDKRNMW